MPTNTILKDKQFAVRLGEEIIIESSDLTFVKQSNGLYRLNVTIEFKKESIVREFNPGSGANNTLKSTEGSVAVLTETSPGGVIQTPKVKFYHTKAREINFEMVAKVQGAIKGDHSN